MTFGERLNYMRKKAVLTQEEVAVHLGISPQAVSKWENDLSCPDIMLLPEIAKLYGVTVDLLLSDDADYIKSENIQDCTQSDRKAEKAEKIDKPSAESNMTGRLLKVNVLSKQGDDINVKLPVSLVKSLKGVLKGISFGNNSAIDLSEIDFDAVFELVEAGAIGDIVNVNTSNGDRVRVYIE